MSLRHTGLFISTGGAPPVVVSLPWLQNSNTLARGKMLKNTASQSITALLLDTDGVAVTSGTTTVYVVGDGVAGTSGAATHIANGAWSFTPSQANTNYSQIEFLFTNTSAVSASKTAFTEIVQQTVDNDIKISLIPTTAMRGTDNAATATNLALAQLDLDKITGSDGVTLATAQALYAPNKVVPASLAEFNARTLEAIPLANLSLMYDGTGYEDPTAPSSRGQVGFLAAGTASISTIAASRVLTTGTEVNSLSDTYTLNGVEHEISDSSGAFDLYYEFDISDAGVGTECTMNGRLNGSNDTLAIFAYNWDLTNWDQIGLLIGNNGSTNDTALFNLLLSHTGTGINAGKVRVRGYAVSGLTSSTLYLDQVYISYAVVYADVNNKVTDILDDTNELQLNQSDWTTVDIDTLLTTQMTESYAADGVAPTLTQAIMLIQQTIGDFAITGTTLTTKKIDGTTTAATYTLDSATAPTSKTRAT